MDNTILKLRVKRDERIIPELASFISNSANKLGLSKKKAFYLCFVLETALELRINALEKSDDEIEVSVIDSGSYFKFSLTDLGQPYILTKNQQSILQRKLVDKYFFAQNGRKGQCFSFVYYYDALNNSKQIIVDKEELLDEEFTYSKLKIDDESILEAIKCLYACYGYEYYHQNLYSVDSFKKYVASGRYIPIVCQNKHKQVVCYCALDENTWFLSVPELSNLTTKPIARGKGLAQTIFAQAENIAKAEGYKGVHVSAVAYHPYTQKMCNKLNYTASAIEYSINPKGTAGLDRRSDCVIGIKIFDKEKHHDLYIDERCNDVISSIFDQQNLNYTIHNESFDNQLNTSDLECVIDIDTTNCFIKLDACSKNIKDEIKEIIDKEEIKALDVITINLNMNNINALDGYQALVSLGFICCGCLPGCENGDYMIMQLFKEEPQYDKIVLLENYQQLKEKLDKVNK